MKQISSQQARKWIAIWSVFVWSLSGYAASWADAAVLFDGARGSTPDLQDWLYQTNPLVGAAATQSATNGVTHLDTMAVIDDQAGYFSALPYLGSHPGVPVLDRSVGYGVRWDALIRSESHVSNDRAGFSVIVIGQDLKGLEIGFWQNEIWIQNDGNDDASEIFTHGEGADFNTTAALTRYDLKILGDGYDLLADGMNILSGSLRDYSSYSNPNPLLEIPYKSPSFIFLGDDTSSAKANIDLAFVSVVIPEPSTAMMWFLIVTVLVLKSRSFFSQRLNQVV